MAGRIWNVQVHHPGSAAGESGEHYWMQGLGALDTGRVLAERLGAIRLPHPRGAVVYADPAAHPFCLGDLAEPDPAVEEVHRQWRDSAAVTYHTGDLGDLVD